MASFVGEAVEAQTCVGVVVGGWGVMGICLVLDVEGARR